MGRIVLKKMTKRARAERRKAIHTGPRGGKYINKHGKKQYI
jgi:hypothetical protein